MGNITITNNGNGLQNRDAFAKNTRIDYYDIAKGIGILLVVWAHGSGPFSRYIYQFHMPFFFLISGLLYNSKSSLKRFIGAKIKSLYVPFVFWNILFYTIKSVLRGVSSNTILRNVLLIILTLSKDGEFFGATWFLGALFLVSIIYKLFDTLMLEVKYRDFVLLGFSSILTLVAMQITFPYMLSRTVICGWYFSLGVVLKNNKDKLNNFVCFGSALAAGCTFLLIAHFGSANMGKNSYRYPLQFILGAVLASYALLYICCEFDKRAKILMPVKKLLIYLGKHSLDIVIWQFVSFRLVILLQMYMNGELITLDNVLSYYPCYSTANGWWLVYTIVGTCVPIALCEFLRCGYWGKILKKIHIV